MKNSNILNNSKEFFDSLSTEEFDNLLSKFGFEYEDISTCTNEIKSLKKYIQNTKINLFINRKLYSCISDLKDKEKSQKVIINNLEEKNRNFPIRLMGINLFENKKENLNKSYFDNDNEYDWNSVGLGAA